MTKKEIQSYFQEIHYYLERKQLKRAFEVLTILISNLQDYQLQERLFELEDHYKMMLTYLIKGIQDPQQEKVYHDLIRSVYRLMDQSSSLIKMQNSWSFYYEKKKDREFSVSESSLQLKEMLDDLLGKISLAELLEGDVKTEESLQTLEREREAIEQKVFYKIWLSDRSEEHHV